MLLQAPGTHRLLWIYRHQPLTAVAEAGRVTALNGRLLMQAMAPQAPGQGEASGLKEGGWG